MPEKGVTHASHGILRLLHVVNTAVIALEYAAALAVPDDLPARLRDDGEAARKHRLGHEVTNALVAREIPPPAQPTQMSEILR
jgi:hypothetical protein